MRSLTGALFLFVAGCGGQWDIGTTQGRLNQGRSNDNARGGEPPPLKCSTSTDDMVVAPNGAIYLAGNTCVNGDRRRTMVEATVAGVNLQFNAEKTESANILFAPRSAVHRGKIFATLGWYEEPMRHFFGIKQGTGGLDPAYAYPLFHHYDQPVAGGIAESITNGAVYLSGAVRCLSYDDPACGQPILKFTASGARDSSFRTPAFRVPSAYNSVREYPVRGIFLDASQTKLYAYGEFESYGNVGNTKRLVRIDGATGALDTTFQPRIQDMACYNESGYLVSRVRTALLHKNGSVYVANANFTDTNIYNQQALARLKDDGSRDPAFQLATDVIRIVDWRFKMIAAAPSGRLYVTSQCQSDSRKRCIVAITENGQLDTTFNPIRLSASRVNLAVAPDETLFVSGVTLEHPQGGYAGLLAYDPSGQLVNGFPELRY